MRKSWTIPFNGLEIYSSLIIITTRENPQLITQRDIFSAHIKHTISVEWQSYKEIISSCSVSRLNVSLALIIGVFTICFSVCPKCVGFFCRSSFLLSRASVTVKCHHSHPCLFSPALPGLWLLRNGCRDCNRVVWLPFWKKLDAEIKNGAC